MTFKPSQQNPTRSGTDDAAVIQAPIRVQTRVVASDDFIESMQSGGVSPDAIANPIIDRYASKIQRFVDVNRQQRDLGGLAQQRTRLELPGLTADYHSNQGAEDLQMSVFPETSFQKETGGEQKDRLMDGYVFLFVFASAPGPIFKPGFYWVQIDGVKHPVDLIKSQRINGTLVYDSPFGQDSNVAWLPNAANSDVTFQDSGGNGFVGSGAVAKGLSRFVVVVLAADLPNVNHTNPFQWVKFDDPSQTFTGGFTASTFLPAPPPSTEVVTFSVNGKQLGTVDVPLTDDGGWFTVLLKFGPDATREHSYLDVLQPANTKFLNRIIPKRKDKKLPLYVFLDFFNVFHPSVVTPYVIEVPRGTLDDTGRNVFSSNTEIGWGCWAEFYDRKDKRIVAVSPHFGTVGGPILTNDKSLFWGFEVDYDAQTFDFSERSTLTLSNVSNLIINFKNPRDGINPIVPLS